MKDTYSRDRKKVFFKYFLVEKINMFCKFFTNTSTKIFVFEIRRNFVWRFHDFCSHEQFPINRKFKYGSRENDVCHNWK